MSNFAERDDAVIGRYDPDEHLEKQILTYEAPWLIYSMGFSVRMNEAFRLGIGSLIEDQKNKVEIIKFNEESGQFESKCSFNHNYPPTKLMWLPAQESNFTDLLATSGDYLRIWSVGPNNTSVSSKSVLAPQGHFCAPLTSFDWNSTDPSMIGTSSIDTTCTIWDIEKSAVKSQLIAHSKEVYDIGFAQGIHTFATAGADGSVRHFDLRNLESTTIIYETNDQSPLLRIAWNKQDPNFLATILMDSNMVVILDIRMPYHPVSTLNGHTNCVNTIAWAPHSSCHICTAGDDKQALIWDLKPLNQVIEDPILAYTAKGEVSMLQWSASLPEWVSITFNDKLQILKI